jgi:drug/metabolite transporter (DMT)-like permease
VVVALAAAAWLRERVSPVNLAGIGLTLAAVLLTIAQGSPRTLLTLSVNRGDVIILVSQSLWVVYTLYSRANLSTFSPLQMLAGAHVVAAGLLLPMALVERPWQAFAHASWVGGAHRGAEPRRGLHEPDPVHGAGVIGGVVLTTRRSLPLPARERAG